VLGETDSDQALQMALNLCPDVMLIDVDMPHMDGIGLAKKIHKFCPRTAVIFLSMRDDLITCERAAQAGAVALVGKFLSADTLMAQIRLYGSIYYKKIKGRLVNKRRCKNEMVIFLNVVVIKTQSLSRVNKENDKDE
jgi:DNA-binding NarL/FixJ family response regulator